jgi:hypothetical protein
MWTPHPNVFIDNHSRHPIQFVLLCPVDALHLKWFLHKAWTRVEMSDLISIPVVVVVVIRYISHIYGHWGRSQRLSQVPRLVLDINPKVLYPNQVVIFDPLSHDSKVNTDSDLDMRSLFFYMFGFKLFISKMRANIVVVQGRFTCFVGYSRRPYCADWGGAGASQIIISLSVHFDPMKVPTKWQQEPSYKREGTAATAVCE